MYQDTILHFAEVARDKCRASERSLGGFFVGAMLAGAYIGIAMILALSVASGLPSGVGPLVMGAVFGVGLILTVFAGGELFTGYIMYLGFGLARRTVGWAESARVLTIVWIGNLVGSLLLAGLFALGGGGAVFANGGVLLHGYVAHKVDADAVALLARATLCNWLVCLAIWTSVRVHGDAAKCIVLAWILMAFVAAGFEHSVANMTALALGLLAAAPSIAWPGAIRNLLLVTVGNIAGAAVFLTGAYLLAAKAEGPDKPTPRR